MKTILCANPLEQYRSYQAEIEEAVLAVMRGSQYILGEEVELLEQEFASYIGTTNAIGVANGTDAIELALRALEIGLNDEVITVSHTAVATVAAIEAAGAKPVLVDVEQKFYTINPLKLEEVLTTNTKAIIAVHIYGQAADLDALLKFCQKHDIFLIEDASQAHGAKYKGQRLGGIGDIGCFSCYPTKNLGAIGDAGLITTNNSDLALKIRMLREYGWNNRVSEYAGRNSRLDELQAAILRIKLRNLDSDNAKRCWLAKYYIEQLSGLAIQLPILRPEVDSVFHLFVLEVENRFGLLEYLKEEDVHLGIHYSLPVHLHPAYKGRLNLSNDMSVTENLVNRIVSLPMYPELTMNDARKVADLIKFFFKISPATL